MAAKEISMAKALRQQRAKQITPSLDSEDYFIVDNDGFVLTQDDSEPVADVMAKFVSNQGITSSVWHKGEILTTYTNGVLS